MKVNAKMKRQFTFAALIVFIVLTMTAMFSVNNVYAAEMTDAAKLQQDLLSIKLPVSKVTEDAKLELPTQGKNGSTITWTSNNPAIANDGTVTLPETGSVSVTLFAKGSLGSQTRSRNFWVTVNSKEMTNAEADNDALPTIESPIKEATTLNLPTKGEHGSTITWSSNNTEYVSNDGVVTLPANDKVSVQLTATVVNGSSSPRYPKTYYLTVQSKDYTDVSVAYDKLPSIPSTITRNTLLDLPTKGEMDTEIIWESKNTSVIDNDGTVTLPAANEASVKLNAVVKKGETVRSKSYTIRVRSTDYADLLEDAESLDIATKDIYEPMTLDLPSRGKSGSRISWESDEPIVTNDGVVSLPESDSTTVIMAATLKRGGSSYTKKIRVYVHSLSEGAVSRDEDALTLPSKIKETTPLELPTTGEHGSTITWKSNDESTISPDGTVTLPEEGSKSVSLTATLTKGADSSNKYFTVLVCSVKDQNQKVTVHLTVLGDDHHENGEHQNFFKWIDNLEMTYTVADRTSVAQMLKDAGEKTGLSMDLSGSYMSGMTSPYGCHLTEKQINSQTGWMYHVTDTKGNTTTPMIPITGYIPSDGETINVHFVNCGGKGDAVDVLSIENAEETVARGESKQIVAKFAPVEAKDTAIEWTSSDPDIAKVDKDGNVTGKKVGEVVITATACNYYKATAKVTVVKNDTDKAMDQLQQEKAAAEQAAADAKALAEQKDAEAEAAKKEASEAKALAEQKDAEAKATKKEASEAKALAEQKDAEAKAAKKEASEAKALAEQKDAEAKAAKKEASDAKALAEQKDTEAKAAKKDADNAKTAKAQNRALGKVQSLKAKVGKKKVTLKWKKVQGASQYQIFRANKKKGSYKLVKTCKSNKVVIKKLSKGKRYSFKVRAVKNVKSGQIYGAYSTPKYTAKIK